MVRGPSGAPPGGGRHDWGEVAPVAPAPLGADGVQPLTPNPLGVGRGAARCRGFPRQTEEVGLTLVFLGALRVWLNDASPGQRRTRAFLRRNLHWLDWLPRRSAARGNRAAPRPGGVLLALRRKAKPFRTAPTLGEPREFLRALLVLGLTLSGVVFALGQAWPLNYTRPARDTLPYP